MSWKHRGEASNSRPEGGQQAEVRGELPGGQEVFKQWVKRTQAYLE